MTPMRFEKSIPVLHEHTLHAEQCTLTFIDFVELADDIYDERCL